MQRARLEVGRTINVALYLSEGVSKSEIQQRLGMSAVEMKRALADLEAIASLLEHGD